MPIKKEIIVTWLRRIQRSELSVSQFTSKYTVPFSRSQYFVYKKKFAVRYIDGLADQRNNGKNRKMNLREEAFLQGYVNGSSSIVLEELQTILKDKFDGEVSLTTIKRQVDKTRGITSLPKIGRPLSRVPKRMYNPLGGFELLVAMAYYLKWPQRTTDAITRAKGVIKSEDINQNCQKLDFSVRNQLGQFTSSYNQRLDVRKKSEASVSDKRKHKNWNSLSIVRAIDHTIY